MAPDFNPDDIPSTLPDLNSDGEPEVPGDTDSAPAGRRSTTLVEREQCTPGADAQAEATCAPEGEGESSADSDTLVDPYGNHSSWLDSISHGPLAERQSCADGASYEATGGSCEVPDDPYQESNQELNALYGWGRV